MRIKEYGKGKKWKWIFFLYVLIIIRLIIFKYPYSELRDIMAHWRKDVVWEGLSSANFTLFKTIRMYIRYYDRLNSFENLFGNILIFVPYGALYPLAFPKKRDFLLFLPAVFLFVTGIELFQLLSAFGAFDVDDILLNCLGAVIGFIFMIAVQKIKW
ncbi:VanZ family protein [Lachnospiraceae bacterium JLR.KK008]